MGRLPLAFFFLLALFCWKLQIISSTPQQLCSHKDRLALLRFVSIFSINKAASLTLSDRSGRHNCENSYPKTQSWKEGTDCCSWDGVTCNDVDGHVIGLDLSCSWLQGPMPSNATTLLHLPRLQKLNLAFNYFNFSNIPPDILGLPSLEHLNLSSAGFFGEIVPESAYLSKLVVLDLSMNFFKLEMQAFGRMIQNMTKLQQLVLDLSDMSSVSLGSLRNLTASLTYLSLYDCNLQGQFMGEMFQQLQNLEILKLGYNPSMTGLFPQLNQSSSLKFLDLHSTKFTGGLPDSIGNLKSLQTLELTNCFFHGLVPASIGNLTQLTHLGLAANNFSGEIPSSISNLRQLNELNLGSNNFFGPIPASLGNLAQIISLELFSNGLFGEIPDIFLNLTQLSVLDMSNNKLVGHVPSQLGELPNLTYLSFTNNALNGTIPSWIFSLPLLNYLKLDHNQLTGHIGVFQSKSLQLIDLNHNKLDGSIPSSVFELENLTLLDLGSNNLSGTLDLSMFTKLRKLENLILSHNNLTLSTNFVINSSFPSLSALLLASCNLSAFPDILRNMPRLYILDLSDNQIHGEIPDWFWEVGKDSLAYLDLSHNFLTSVRQIPWKQLRSVDLHSNLIEGPLPVPLSDGMQILLMSDNKLTGELPPFICHMIYPEILVLSDNSLSGIIPECLSNFSLTFSVLDLRRNSFHGTIPDTFTSGCLLRTINLNGNNFEGSVPPSFANCTQLEVLDIGKNKMNGGFPYWLGALQGLRVLVLHSNQFHGRVSGFASSTAFPSLQILDVSGNNFNGSFTSKDFAHLMTMQNAGEGKSKVVGYIGGTYHQDSVRVTFKGFEFELERILTIFTTIDFSNNSFEGTLPASIGDLGELKVLNFSHNNLAGQIPSSLGNLKEIESVDLSSNNLTGKIPKQLVSLTYLEVLNLSYNKLFGPIPQGNQFNTFENDSYVGNSGLCGWPLSKKCSTGKVPPPPPTPEEEDASFLDGFGWRCVVMGYGCGVVFGIMVGCVVVWAGKPRWLAQRVERECRRIERKRIQRRRERTNHWMTNR